MNLGYGRNFIGDGYRSLLAGDGASPYPFVKINTTFWKIKYTNTYMWLKDVRADATVDRTYATKYMANHYLSWNVSKRLNIGFFESVVWSNQNNRGFDINFVNYLNQLQSLCLIFSVKCTKLNIMFFKKNFCAQISQNR